MEHISLPRDELQSHADDIEEAFKLANNDKAVKDLIAEGLEKGGKVGDSIIWDVPDSEYKLKIVLSPDYLGSITTSHPYRG
ncbi:MAG: hypothetical protein U9N61_12530 [Euryarchaeota archaeon]|nr:hypothetical protein [Euryarchaeota archaeon]